jgi:hypothetical protein
MSVRQVTPLPQWPSGDSRPIAIVPFEPAELSRRYQLEFEQGIDDLDRYLLAAVELTNGEQAWLLKYNNDPNPGTVIHVDAAANVEDAQALLLDALQIERDTLLWEAPASSLAR